jgi:hypothetical protein
MNRAGKSLILLAGISELAYASLYIFPASPSRLYLKYIATATTCFALYVAALALIKRIDTSQPQHIAIIFLFGAIFRLTLVAMPPLTSDDIYRYIWDGRVQAAGINPYRFAPNAPELSGWRDENIYPNINHADLPTIYPPLAQIEFLLAYLLGGSLLGFKLMLFLAELLSGWLLMKILRRAGLATAAILVYLWCPRPILEFSLAGHMDALGIPLLLLFLLFMLADRWRAAAIALAGAALIKFLPIIFLPIALRRLGGKRAIEFTLIFALTIFIGYLPYLSAGAKVVGSFGAYIQHWSFNGSIFTFIQSLGASYQGARIICYFALAIWITIVTWREREFIAGLFWTLAGAYIFSPTLFPWYLSWMLPLLIWQPSPAFFWLLMSAQLSYWARIDLQLYHQWREAAQVRAIEYLPFFFLLGYQLLGRQWQNRSSSQLSKEIV